MGALDDEIRRIERQLGPFPQLERELAPLRQMAQRVEREVESLRQSQAASPPVDLAGADVPSKTDADVVGGYYKCLTKWIREYEDGLDDEHEVGVRFVNFGQPVTFHVTAVTCWHGGLIRFDGIDQDGSPVQLVQHVSRIGILLTRAARRSAAKSRIDFHAQT